MPHMDFERHVESDNDNAAHRLRAFFKENSILAINLIGSAGSGKTKLLQQTLSRMPSDIGVYTITGDIQPNRDAELLSAYGLPVKQISTLGVCHLEAPMVQQCINDWDPREIEILLIENVGDLICPSTWDLGEETKVAVVSVAEGDDKPLKYPSLFTRAELLIITKTDLLPHVDFDVEKAIAHAREVNPEIQVVTTSSVTGAGIDDWMDWLRRRYQDILEEVPPPPVTYDLGESRR